MIYHLTFSGQNTCQRSNEPSTSQIDTCETRKDKQMNRTIQQKQNEYSQNKNQARKYGIEVKLLYATQYDLENI